MQVKTKVRAGLLAGGIVRSPGGCRPISTL
jgi:hypothetical protein